MTSDFLVIPNVNMDKAWCCSGSATYGLTGLESVEETWSERSESLVELLTPVVMSLIIRFARTTRRWFIHQVVPSL